MVNCLIFLLVMLEYLWLVNVLALVLGIYNIICDLYDVYVISIKIILDNIL